jgi:glycosyltransferase involved in cell wall biosynthesis
MPLISVVLPVYNGVGYLTEAVDSILAQTFSDFELIMIDDGSTDESWVMLEAYAIRDSRVRVFKSENNGLATTLNNAIDLARGIWIARMDQDDIALPNRFERQLAWLEKTGADISGSWVQRFGSADKRVIRLRQTDEAIKMEMLFCSPFAHPSVMMRTELVKRLRYDKAWDKSEDYDLWERAAEAGWKMTNIPEVLLMYRVHDSQISSLTGHLQQQQGYEISRRYWRFIFRTLKLNENSVDESIKVFGPSCGKANVDALDASLTVFMRHSHGEARDVVFAHAIRLYLRVAANCPDIVSRWGRLNNEFGRNWGFFSKFKLMLFRLFRIQVDGVLFRQLRKFEVWRTSV